MPAGGKPKWKLEHDAALTAHVLLGELPYSRICGEINCEFGTRYTRNATIGRAKRLGLKTIDGAEKRKHKGRFAPPPSEPAKRAVPPKPAVAIPLRCAEVTAGNLRLIELGPDACRFPIDDISPFFFCGQPQVPNESYCPGHFRLTRQ
jgi:GcrA cell cycle regulator